MHEGLGLLFQDQGLRATLLDHAAELALPTPQGLQTVVANYFFEHHQGEFVFEKAASEATDADVTPKVMTVDRGTFMRAMTDPAELERMAVVLEGIVQSQGTAAEEASIR